MQKTKNVATTLSIEMYGEFKDRTVEYETTPSQLLREFIEAFLDDRLAIRKIEKIEKIRSYERMYK